MTWDETGKATLYLYEKGTWAAPVFTPDANGTFLRTSRVQGFLSSSAEPPVPVVNRTVADFQNIPSHSTKEVTISGPPGTVREETYVCDAGGVYQLAVAKDHEYESEGLLRHVGVKINGVYLSKTEYVAPLITRWIDQNGTTTETEINNEGEVIRRTVSGNAEVPPVTTTYETTGLTTTTRVNGQVVSVEKVDALGRGVYSEDATGAIVTTHYGSGGRVVTRTSPGNITM